MRLIVGGLLVGLAVVFEYQTLFAAAVVGLYALWRLRRELPQLLWFVLGALGPALALALYHQALFGSPLALPYAHLDDEGFRLFHHSHGFMGLGPPRGRVIASAFLSTDYGLFAWSPFLALGLLVALWACMLRRRDDSAAAHAVTLAVTLVMALFLGGMANWRAGWCAGGPRYIAAVVPFLAFSLALAWKPLASGTAARAAAARALLTALVLVSVFLCGLGGALFPHFPIQFDNPIFDLVLPLLREGYVAHGLGTVLGLSGLLALAPWLLVVAVAIGGVIAGLWVTRPRWATWAAVALAAAWLVALSTIRTGRDREEERTRDTVRGMWEPPPRS